MMKKYYKADNELVKQVIDYFSPESDGRLIRKEFEIGGRTWLCTGSGWMTNHGGSLPTDARMKGEVELQQRDGTRHPQITLTINVGSGH